MQAKVTALQEKLAGEVFESSVAGGAVVAKFNGQGDFVELTIDPDFLKEDAEMVQSSISSAISQAQKTAKAASEEQMNALSGAMGGAFGGLMG